MLVSATLSDRLAQLAQRLLRDPVAIGLHVQYDAQRGLLLREKADARAEAFEMPAGLQQLFMDVPTKLRLPTLLGAPPRVAHRQSILLRCCRHMPVVIMVRVAGSETQLRLPTHLVALVAPS